ncbi:hypothetical protein V9T40_007436 [Parthenolecanium corni]|uniref:Uncharacterized protein n=1 Tax=Parthenolecanium corni TaxID=536013 RepID=A0AAN9TWC9_9HEMI
MRCDARLRDAAKGSRVAVAVATRAARPDSIFAPSAAGCAPAPVTTRPARPTVRPSVRPSVHRSIGASVDRSIGWLAACCERTAAAPPPPFDSIRFGCWAEAKAAKAAVVVARLGAACCAFVCHKALRRSRPVVDAVPPRVFPRSSLFLVASRRVANHLAAPSADYAPQSQPKAAFRRRRPLPLPLPSLSTRLASLRCSSSSVRVPCRSVCSDVKKSAEPRIFRSILAIAIAIAIDTAYNSLLQTCRAL